MKFNELTIRELRAQATSACIKAVRLLEKSQLSKFDVLTVDYISPMTTDEDEDSEYFDAIGSIWLTDGAKVPFKANLVWLGDGCDLSGPDGDSVEFIETDIQNLRQEMELGNRRYSYGIIEKDGRRYTKDGYYYIIRTEDAESYTKEEYCIHPDGTCLYRFESEDQ